MSQGLGRNQRLVLETLQRMERENPLAKDGCYRVWYLLDRLYEFHFRARDEAKRADLEARLCAEAQSDDPKVREEAESALATRKMFGAARDPGFEWLLMGKNRNKRRDAADLEFHLNPSRLLAQLERRGLVERTWGGVRLTEDGRHWGRPLSFRS
jgi:hypothetical protein